MKYPYILCNIILAISFLTILLSNLIFKKKLISYLFLTFGIIYIILIVIFDSNFVYEFLKNIITYIWYPNYLVFVITILFSVIVLLLSIFKKDNSIIKSIINYILFSICFGCYTIFLSLDIDPNTYSSLYQINSLILMRIVSITFIIWVFMQIVLRMRGKNEK